MVPEPVVNGTMGFIAIAAILAVITLFGRCVGLVSKDTAQVSLVLYALGAFCTWLLWYDALFVSISHVSPAGSVLGCINGIRYSYRFTKVETTNGKHDAAYFRC